MIKKNKIILAILIVLGVVSSAIAMRDRKDDRLYIDLKPIKTSGGWGYEIAVDQKTFIRQEYVPAVEGQISFKTSADALLVGTHAVDKLKHGVMPVITRKELNEWGIIKN